MIDIQKTDDPKYIRDRRTTAVLNIDREGYEQFKLERAKAKELLRVSQEVRELQQAMTEIKQLLKQIVNG